MARKTNGKAEDKQAAALNGAGAAGARALRIAAAAGNGHDPAHGASRTVQLALMCRRAADHLAQAHSALFEGREDSDAALAHLDRALDCLKTVAANGPAPRPAPPLRKPKTA